ncbi:MBL fold metallo-hydrolase [Virgibacillus halodenitrificans]|nr:MBL fold metallo-hydrolase [Virgibacillus halodenitrificans]
MVNNPYENKVMPMTSVGNGNVRLLANDVHCYTNKVVNLCFVGSKEHWVLVDAGMPRSADEIEKEAEKLFGKNSRPEAIILTHGHFDHVGSAAELLRRWDVPVYAHPLEIPYITNETSYLEPDPTVAGGLVAKLSKYFPNEPIDLSGYVHELPVDGTVPHMPDWKWYHTPGHTPGHVSLFRESDSTLIAGDAFTTVKQDEMFEVIKQEKEINGPPRYFTPDWEAAENSVKKLASLDPLHAVTGHGIPMLGDELQQELDKLTRNFQEIAVPEHGKYVREEKD